jgi:5-methylcytosine-specific restriction endonuclease McrA
MGLKLYFTGTPCRNGHVAKRITNGRKCLECSHVVSNAWKQGKRDKLTADHRAWREANREHYRAYRTAHRTANLELARAKERARYAANSDVYRAAQKRCYNYEQATERVRQWRTANPEKARALDSNKRARKRNAAGSYTGDDLLRIRSSQNDLCAYCRTKLNGRGDMDHISPLSKGGSNWPSNIQLLCSPCNNRKRARDALDFARELGLLL